MPGCGGLVIERADAPARDEEPFKPAVESPARVDGSARRPELTETVTVDDASEAPVDDDAVRTPVDDDAVRTSVRLTIRHLSGSRANEIEEFRLDAINELTMGRDPACSIAFDAVRDATVSRRHAVIRIVNGDQLGFTIADLGSLNGTLVNGDRINRETDLLPGDTVQMGIMGPSFVFDAQPRPAHFVARTRIISAGPST
jgi:hypothetical protein